MVVEDEKGEGEVLLAYPKEPTPSAAVRQQSPLVQAVTALPALLSTLALIVMVYALQDTIAHPALQLVDSADDAASVVTTDQGDLQGAKQEMEKLRKQLRVAAQQARNFQNVAKGSKAQVAKLKAALAEAQAQQGSQTLRLGGEGAAGGVGNAEQLEALLGTHSQLQQCPKDQGDDASEACKVARAVLRSALNRAEEQYNINLRNRKAMDRGTLMTNPGIARVRLKEAVLLPTWPCPLEGRFGLWGEGGKWLCLVHSGKTQEPMTFSIGSRGDVSFESEMSKRLNATIHTFDPTLDGPQQRRMRAIPYLSFHNAGLSGKDQIIPTRAKFPPQFRNAVLLTVPEVLEALNVSYVDVFKIDCEGCEYGVVEDMVKLYDRTTVPFGQILMEVHFLIQQHIAARNLVTRLEGLGYRMYHSEPNAYYAAGYEVAFIHENLTRV